MANSSGLVLVQLAALLRKNFIQKWRNASVTFCELFSPILMMLILVLGFSLSEIDKYEERNYAQFNIRIPPPNAGTFDAAALNSSAQFGLSQVESIYNIVSDVLTGPLPAPSFDTFVGLGTLISSNLDTDTYQAIVDDFELGRTYGNLFTLGSLHFAPDIPATYDLIEYLNTTTRTFRTLKHYVHESASKGVKYINSHLEERAWALVAIRDAELGEVDYTIRMNYTTLPNTNLIVNYVTQGLDLKYQRYYLSGFLSLQQAIDEWAFNYTGAFDQQGPTTCEVPSASGVPFPTPQYEQNIFYAAVGYLLGLAMVMANMYPMSRLVKSLVEEKESRMRELMRIMGMTEFAYKASWFLTAFVTFLWISVTVTWVVSTSFLPNSTPSLLFVYFFFFTMSLITFSCLIATFFSKAKLAAIVGPVALFGALMPRYVFYGSNRYEAEASKYWASLLSPTAFTFGADILAEYEYAGIGVGWDNITEGDYSFLTVLGMLLLDFVLYGVLAWYLDQVLPSEWGVPKHPLFLFQRSYWFPRRTAAAIRAARHEDDSLSAETPFIGAEVLEQVGPELAAKERVSVRNLVKQYDDGKVAVRGLNLHMYEDQITCLLGHNGAGKTTTISILTGLLPPTAGSVSIYGFNMPEDMEQIRMRTGLCPQHNVLFSSLTVKEHLHFFACMKNIPSSQRERSVIEKMDEVGLAEKAHADAAALSGGMKRKLSVAIALTGSPSFVLLDEPTSGMDPYSRRATWELLRKSKQGRVMVLTTHFMDEADILGDRIAVMSNGRLQCAGSSLFLKNRFGAGYMLTINTSARANHAQLVDFIQSHIPSANVRTNVAAELVVQLPIDSAHAFAAFFADLKANRTELSIASYGMSITTLEHVFLQLALESKARGESTKEADDEAYEMLATAQHAKLPEWFRPISRAWQNFMHSRPQRWTRQPESASQAEYEPLSCPDRQRSWLRRIFGEVLPHRGSSDNARQVHVEKASTADEAAAVELVGVGEKSVAVEEQIYKSAAVEGQLIEEVKDMEELEPQLDADELGQELEEVSFNVQMIELLRKRFVTAKRDLKGFFFQIVLPAFLIMMVMLILTVDVPIAGPSITLHGKLYDEKTEVMYSNDNPLVVDLEEAKKLAYEPSTTNSSYDLSEELLATYNDHGDRDRFGAYVFNDSIPTNVTVDWNWVKENIDVILDNADTIEDIISEATGEEFSFNDIIADDGIIDLSELLDNVEVTDDMIDELIDRLFQNQTEITVNNRTITIDQFEEFMDAFIGNRTATPDATITYDHVEVDLPSRTITLEGVELLVNNQTFDLGDIVLNITDVAALLPNETITYFSTITPQYTSMHNASSPHAVAVFRSELVRAAYRNCFGSSASYTARNHPLPLTAQQTIEVQTVLAVFASLFILIPLCYIPAAFCIFIVRERANKSKHLQMVSGVSMTAYWVSTFLWDMCLYAVLTGLTMAALAIFKDDAAQVFIGSGESALSTFLLIFLFGLSTLPLSYIYSFAFDNHSTAQISIMGLNFITGFVMVLAYFIMISIPSTREAGQSLVHLFRLFPPYNVGDGLINLSSTYYQRHILGANVGYFDWEVTGRPLTFMACEAVVYFAIVLLSEAPVLARFAHWLDRVRLTMNPPAPETADADFYDEDVSAEQKKVDEIPANSRNCVLRLHNVEKTYPAPLRKNAFPKRAVRRVSLAIPAGECFGFLGINGAGKTTTLSVLTGDIQATAGSASIQGIDIGDPRVRQLLGYCPQVDPLLELMTGRETLWMFGRLRGISVRRLDKTVSKILTDVGLMRYADTVCGAYSGGNKRKLSLAVALIGEPPLLLLDEPSTGMDPEARRNMWDLIADIARRHSVILTTHSMEEAEALCNRIAIMVAGKLRCLGTSQHLKHRFGAGYQIDLHCEESFADVLQQAVEQELFGSKLGLYNKDEDFVVQEQHGGFLTWHLPGSTLDLSESFAFFERNRDRFGILDYNISQCTLEQIFIRFAKAHDSAPN